MNYSRTFTNSLKLFKHAMLYVTIALFIGTLFFDIGAYLPYILAVFIATYLFEMFLMIPLENKMEKLENNLISTNNNLRQQNDDLEEMTRGMVHDLKRPLRSMSSFAQLARRRLPEHAAQDIKEYLDYINNSAGRMSGLLDAIMNFSKVNRQEYMNEKVLLDEVMDEVKLNILNIIETKKAHITTFNMPVVNANRLQMMQLLQNLLENAIKYNENPQPEITIKGEENENEYIISVKDNGIGIEDDYREKVFELFQRLNPHIYEGTGVGLATCKRIVDNHNGEIWLESVEGEGTTFFVKMPKPKTIKMGNSVEARSKAS